MCPCPARLRRPEPEPGREPGGMVPPAPAEPRRRASTATQGPRCAMRPTIRRASATPTPSPCSARRAQRWRSSAGSRTTCDGTPSVTTSPTSSTGTSTSRMSATPDAGSARLRSDGVTPTPTRCPSRRSAPGPKRRGRSAPPRYACRGASTRTCPGPPTSTWPARSRAGCPVCTCMPILRWRSSTGSAGQVCPSATG